MYALPQKLAAKDKFYALQIKREQRMSWEKYPCMTFLQADCRLKTFFAVTHSFLSTHCDFRGNFLMLTISSQMGIKLVC